MIVYTYQYLYKLQNKGCMNSIQILYNYSVLDVNIGLYNYTYHVNHPSILYAMNLVYGKRCRLIKRERHLLSLVNVG